MVGYLYVLPAPAGINRVRRHLTQNLVRVPRASGDKPDRPVAAG
ncbi:hypothetical protein AC15_3071 [Escherichia coli 2-156-04_S3_C2]|nr:hypothetical protein AC15_3071 [Escherichia coli 2-156-04_S3_C2]